jgi:hypothetical protein
MVRVQRISGSRCALVIVGCAALVACATPGPAPRGGEVDPGVALFVSGRYAEAVAAFEAVLDGGAEPAVKREACYYLGRAYLELGDERAAIDAFATGVRLGDEGPCLAYLEWLQSRLAGDPGHVRRMTVVSRTHMAGLVAHMLSERNRPVVAADEAPLDALVRMGWLERLPDGALHGEAAVTRASFYVMLSRMCAQTPCAGALPPFPREAEPITGPEAMAALERALDGKGSHGG